MKITKGYMQPMESYDFKQIYVDFYLRCVDIA